MLLFFAWASIMVCYLNITSIKGKFIGVLAIDAGLIIGCDVRSIYWRSLHGFVPLWDWGTTASMAIMAILVSGTVWIILFLLESKWPTPTDASSEQ